MNGQKYRTWIEISKSAIKNNYQVFRKRLKPSIKMLGVVKSNAYGHGLRDFAAALASLGIDRLGVDSITEANALRRAGIKLPILVLGFTLPANFVLARDNKIALTISTFENLEILSKLKRGLSIHLKIDTGMHRQGFFVEDLPKVLKIIKANPQIHLEGLYTHFAAAKRPDDTHGTEKQIECFNQAREIVEDFGFTGIISHASATAGTLNFPEAHYDMVRVGIGLYGMWPSPETARTFQNRLQLKPALTWKTVISEVKTVIKGEKVGYDFTQELKRTSRLAVLPIGYWHGYFRAWSGLSRVIIKGQKAKIVGRVAMDMVVADVTDVKDAKVGDEVILIGAQGKEAVTADELADLAGTTCYEVVTRLNPLIKKFYI